MKSASAIVLLGYILTVPSLSSVAYAQLSFEQPPINYSKTASNDPVAALLQKIDRRQFVLKKDSQTGYLSSLLDELSIPHSSQTLVFSKTSMQRHLISSKNPRAIYFNDDTYVGWVPDGELIEIASVDPILGTVFYTIQQPATKHPGMLARQNDQCLFCHASTDTGRVPGLLMRSVYSSPYGDRVFPENSVPTNTRGPLSGRWAGWFVTGTHGTQRHLGNLMISSDDTVTPDHSNKFANISDLSRWFDVETYLSPHSDLVALLVLQHQVSTHNLLTDANHRARGVIHFSSAASLDGDRQRLQLTDEELLQLDQIAEHVVDGLLMIGQIHFSEPVSGTSAFAYEFEKRGPRDAVGRSLRDLDLRDSLFRYPCSYLIYTDAFDSLPEPLLHSVSDRLLDVLESKDNRAKYSHLSVSTRLSVLKILRATKPSLASR